jgi:hypothetical protein
MFLCRAFPVPGPLVKSGRYRRSSLRWPQEIPVVRLSPSGWTAPRPRPRSALVPAIHNVRIRLPGRRVRLNRAHPVAPRHLVHRPCRLCRLLHRDLPGLSALVRTDVAQNCGVRVQPLPNHIWPLAPRTVPYRSRCRARPPSAKCRLRAPDKGQRRPDGVAGRDGSRDAGREGLHSALVRSV